MKRIFSLFVSVPMFLLVLLAPGEVLADTPGNIPVILSTPYPSVTADQGSALTFAIDLSNVTPSYQDVTLTASGPADWNLKLSSGGFTVRQVMIAPTKSQTVNLEVKAPDNAKPQDYVFDLKAVTADGVTLPDLRVDVMAQAKTSTGGLTMTTDYPNLRGQASTSFSFTLNTVNNSDQDRTVNFDTTAPQDWQVTIKPSYQSTQVSSISMKANANQSVEVDVTPPKTAPAGKYPLTVKASAGSDTTQLPLSVVIVGQPSLSLTTASGQLNTQASVTSPSKVTLDIKNTGTEPLQNVSVTASSPDGWQVTFSPNAIANLPANQDAQVTATIAPGNQALAGDYMVTMTASAGSTSDSKDIRVTVDTPTTWGWAAIAAIGIVVVGLGGVFARYSRR